MRTLFPQPDRDSGNGSRSYDVPYARRRWLGLLVVVAGLPVATGCGSLPVEVVERESFDPPAVYREWWKELQRCVGLTGRFDTIDWWTGEALAIEGQEKVGVWLAPNTIILESFYVTSEPAVKHEMLHHLTDGEMPHSAPAFRGCVKTGVRRTNVLGPRPRGRN